MNTISAVTRDLLNLWPVIRDSHRQNSVKMKSVSIHTHIFVLFYSGDLSKTFTTCHNGMACHHVSFYTWLQNHLQEVRPQMYLMGASIMISVDISVDVSVHMSVTARSSINRVSVDTYIDRC